MVDVERVSDANLYHTTSSMCGWRGAINPACPWLVSERKMSMAGGGEALNPLVNQSLFGEPTGHHSRCACGTDGASRRCNTALGGSDGSAVPMLRSTTRQNATVICKRLQEHKEAMWLWADIDVHLSVMFHNIRR